MSLKPLKLNTLIADDERFARERLVKLLESFSIFKISWQAGDGDEVREILKTEKIDVAFLDINMPGESVFNTLSNLIDIPLIIFQTAYSEFAVKAFQINAVDYLLKPIDRELLVQTVERIKNIINQDSAPPREIEHIPLRIGNSIKLIPYSDVFSIISKDGFSYLNTSIKNFISEKSLNYYEDILGQKNFFRVSRSGIINLDKIEKIQKTTRSNYSILLLNDSKVPLSRRRAKKLRRKLGLK